MKASILRPQNTDHVYFQPIMEFPSDSRLWVYLASRNLTKIEYSILVEKATIFLSQWQAHGKDLTATFEFKYSSCLILAVNESIQKATGCSIDASVSFIRQLETTLGISFLDRSLVGVVKNGILQRMSISQASNKAKKGELVHYKILNNAVSTVGEYNTGWEVPVDRSWLSKFLPTVS